MRIQFPQIQIYVNKCKLQQRLGSKQGQLVHKTSTPTTRPQRRAWISDFLQFTMSIIMFV